MTEQEKLFIETLKSLSDSDRQRTLEFLRELVQSQKFDSGAQVNVGPKFTD